MSLKQIFYTVLLTGFIGSGIFTLLQSFSSIPLILHAEQFEDGKLINYVNNNEVKISDTHEAEEEEAWAPADGAQRLFFTFVTNFVLAMGFTFLLCGVYLYLQELTVFKGMLVGAVGYMSFFFLPSIGLTPELPGTLAASLESRQIWWVSTVLASLVGFGVLYFSKNILYKALAVVVILAPHIVGAPHPEFHAGTAPLELFETFVQTSFVINAIFWLSLGAISASFYKKFAPQYI
ncbi:CbtA family protein [Sulfurimonas sp. SAG-AH-194-C20]|nr:CbtA family protein [Sulfurimonas sp. SAG-AH-194-C20]MDF1878471.1 CbtA family protein [Sulfurimonas sp. SAG-AH-194-C20]